MPSLQLLFERFCEVLRIRQAIESVKALEYRSDAWPQLSDYLSSIVEYPVIRVGTRVSMTRMASVRDSSVSMSYMLEHETARAKERALRDIDPDLLLGPWQEEYMVDGVYLWRPAVADVKPDHVSIVQQRLNEWGGYDKFRDIRFVEVEDHAERLVVL